MHSLLWAIKRLKSLLSCSPSRWRPHYSTSRNWTVRANSSEKPYKKRWRLEAPLYPSGPDLLTRQLDSNEPKDGFCGKASISFPWLAPERSVEEGLWCRGCERLRCEHPISESNARTGTSDEASSKNVRGFLEAVSALQPRGRNFVKLGVGMGTRLFVPRAQIGTPSPFPFAWRAFSFQSDPAPVGALWLDDARLAGLSTNMD